MTDLFIDQEHWDKIKRGHVYDCVFYYNSDTKRPLTLFVPHEEQIEGEPVTGKLVPTTSFEAVLTEDGDQKAQEHQVVVRAKRRRVVVLSNDIFSSNPGYETVFIAPIITLHNKDGNLYQKLLNDLHPTSVFVPGEDGYERYIALAQIQSVHKSSLLQMRREVIHPERMGIISEKIDFVLNLGLLEPAEAQQAAEETGSA